ncbi:HD domain-containing protein [Streptosporangium longisporum]|uniref:HD/PDEase domain-containing protein n=1 Tax=Streptosporangium longisporum TaxID=46187 RepID=A0ABN3XQL5_9ACTN
MNAMLDLVRTRVLADFAEADSAHDIGHLDRVAALAGQIADTSGADPVQAQVAAYVHDYHRVEETRQGKRPIRPEEVSAAILDVLDRCQVPKEWHPAVLSAVEMTGRYRFAGESIDPRCPVAAAVHDADNLDAMGAIGIGRTFAFGGMLGEPLWDPAAALKQIYQEGHTTSVLAHLYEKLVHLEQDMLTEHGRRLAADRALLLHRFAAEFRCEWTAGRPSPDSTARRVDWDATTRYLSVQEPHAGSGEPLVRIAFRGRVELSFAEHDHLTAVNLLDVPDALTVCIPRADHRYRRPGGGAPAPHEQPWLLDPDGARVWIGPADGEPWRRLAGIGDIEVHTRKGRPVALHLHLWGQTTDRTPARTA